MGRLALGVALVLLVLGGVARAEDTRVLLTLKDHQFIPPDVEIPAGTKVALVIRNQDSTVSEFESVEIHREKVVQAGGEIIVYVGPLDPGHYEFFDDFHPETRGHLIVK